MSDKLDTQHERALIARAQYDPAAFQALYGLYFRRIYAYVAAKVGGERDAEDLVADVFLHVVKHLARFENKRDLSFAAWIFTIARNRVADFYRRQGRAAEEIEIEAAENGESGAPALDHLLIRQEHAAEIRALLDALPERRREVLTLKYFSGLRNLEIAQILGLDERTVASHLNRGLHDLHASYTAKFPEPDGGI